MGNGTQGGAIPSCANKYIMNDLARDEWGFDGCEYCKHVWSGEWFSGVHPNYTWPSLQVLTHDSAHACNNVQISRPTATL